MEDDLEQMLLEEEEMQREDVDETDLAMLMEMEQQAAEEAGEGVVMSQDSNVLEDLQHFNNIDTQSIHGMSDDDSDDGSDEEDDEWAKMTPLERRKFRLQMLKQERQNKLKRFTDVSAFLYTIPKDNDVALTLPSGSRRYMVVDAMKDPLDEDFKLSDVPDLINNPFFNGNGDQQETILEQPIYELEREIEVMEEEEAKQNNDEEMDENDEDMIRKDNDPKSLMFVDKYSPKKFIDLVSNEKQNRITLQWLQSWHRFVFENERDQRPQNLVVMLCGPPGAGKTTLAHIAAAHAGYQVEEVNASDDRTAEVLKNRIHAAMEMQSMFTSNRPKCIVLDEFEGISNQGEGKGAAAVIMEMLKTPLRSRKGDKQGDENDISTESGKKPKKKETHPITRPIILICNDPYVPALRQIRREAMIIHFRNPTKSRVVQRLKEVCYHESIDPHPGTLELIADRAAYDIRSCLHQLQFITTAKMKHRRGTGKGRPLTMHMVEKYSVAEKDHNANLFKTWDVVFASDRSIQRQELFSRTQAASVARRSAHRKEGKILRQFEQHMSELPKLLDGIHENLKHVRLVDTTLSNFYNVLELLGDADVFLSGTSGHEFAFGKYVPPVVQQIRGCCRTMSKPKLSFPMRYHEYTQRYRESREILDTFQMNRKKISPGSLNCGNVVPDILTPMLEIVCPRVRPVPYNLLNGAEKREIENVVEILSNFGVRYRRVQGSVTFGGVQVYDRSGDAGDGAENPNSNNFSSPFEQSTFMLEPRLDQLVTFDEKYSYANKSCVPHPTTAKILEHRLEMVKIKLKNSTGNNDEPVKPKRISYKMKPRTSESALLVKMQVPRDFFGREITANTKKTRAPNPNQIEDIMNNETEPMELESSATVPRKRERDSAVAYRFEEGFTNAIRRPVYMDELMLF